jgi:chloramphenicol 3-O-phosphotransferase
VVLAPVPLLIVTGPVGVGKSAVLHEADRLLVAAEMSHATVVLEEIARCWPVATGEVGDERLVYANLASLWSNFADRGADRLLLELILEDRSQLPQLRRTVPGSEVTVVRLRAPLSVIEERVRKREPSPDAELCGAHWLAAHMDESKIEDYLVENGERPLPDVAAEVLRLADWLPSPG